MGGRALTRLGLVALGALLADQLLQHTALADGVLFERRVAPFDPPLFSPAQFAAYRALAAQVAREGEGAPVKTLFDPDLGWAPSPGTEQGPHVHDWATCRMGAAGPLARERSDGVRRVAAVGCSFTLGSEVEGDQTWASYLDAARADVELANLGMGGYGLDQAILRFVQSGRQLQPDEVWFGWLPAATLRATTHFPPVMHHWTDILQFKPRFRLDADGRLAFARSPVKTRAEALALIDDQQAFLEAVGPTDFWVQRAPLAYAARGSHWSHWFATSRLVLTWREARGRTIAPWLEDERSQVYELARALLLRLDLEARQAGARFRIVVLPSRDDLRLAAEGARYWKPLLDDVRRIGLESFDASDALLAAGAARDDAHWMPGGHYSPAANRVVAEALEALLPR